MAETLISPGVLARENDQSQITSQPIQAGAAIIGPTVKGQVNIPKLITTYSEYQANFGTTFESGSVNQLDEYTFFTSISAYNYFQNGGTSFIVTRFASGSFSPATSSMVDGNTGLVSGIQAFTENTFDAPSATPGTINGVSGTSNLAGSGASFEFVLASDTSLTSIEVESTGSGYVVGEVITIPSASLGATTTGGTDLELTLVEGNIQSVADIFTLETLTDGAVMNSTSTEGTGGILPSGSENNIRWEITSPSTSRGVFTVIIRQGNDTTK